MESFATDPWLSRLMPVVLGPFVGSFLGVLIRRLPAGRPVAWARSACHACDTPLAPADLVPLLSYVFLRGRCRHCGVAIGWFHPAVELVATFVAAAAVITAVDATTAWTACVLGWMLLVPAWIECDHGRLSPWWTLPVLVAGLSISAWPSLDHAILANETWRLPTAPLAGTIAGLGAGVLIGRAGGSRFPGAEAGLMAAGGAWLGWRPLPVVIVVSALAGLLFAGVCRRRLPFGPCLALGIWSVFLWRNGSLG